MIRFEEILQNIIKSTPAYNNTKENTDFIQQVATDLDSK